MMRVYSVPYNGTLTAAGGDSDLLSIQPASGKACELIGWRFGQTSEVGDADEENIRITIRHMTGTVTIGSGGSSVTPVPTRPGTDSAAGFTARCNDTTVSTTSGTSTICEEMAWNERASPWFEYIPEELRKCAVNGEALIVRNESTLADDMSINVTFFVRELA